MSTQYVFVDFENVQPDLSVLAGTAYQVKIFIGAKQLEGRIAARTLVSAVKLGGNLEMIEVSRSGKNAVDMHIAYWIGRILKEEPTAHIHIVSGDSDFDPLIESLRHQQFDCHRTKTLTELGGRKAPRVPAARAAKARNSPAATRVPAAAKSPASDQLSGVLKHLRSMKDKPTTRVKLAKWIDTHFRQHGGEQSSKVVDRTIDELIQLRFVRQDGNRVTYQLSS